jgi:hypothetical protein
VGDQELEAGDLPMIMMKPLPYRRIDKVRAGTRNVMKIRSHL